VVDETQHALRGMVAVSFFKLVNTGGFSGFIIAQHWRARLVG
jgi:hypothetical protein